jgi:hypothetical protein
VLLGLLALYFPGKIQSVGRRWSIYAKGYTSRDAIRFWPVTYIVHSVYKWYAPNTWCLSNCVSWWHCIYATDSKEHYVLRQMQRGLSIIESWCECWNIKINEYKTRAIYFSHRLKPPEAHLTMNGRNIPFINHVKYSGLSSVRRLHGDCTQKRLKPKHSDHLIESATYSKVSV